MMSFTSPEKGFFYIYIDEVFTVEIFKKRSIFPTWEAGGG
jgi:hypothetical protein